MELPVTQRTATASNCTAPRVSHASSSSQQRISQTCDVTWQHDGGTHTARIDVAGRKVFGYEARHLYWSSLVDLAEALAPPRKATFAPR